MVVSLHPLSTKKGYVEKRERFETDEKEEIACVTCFLRGAGDTKTSQRGKENNSYNEEFDPGSG